VGTRKSLTLPLLAVAVPQLYQVLSQTLPRLASSTPSFFPIVLLTDLIFMVKSASHDLFLKQPIIGIKTKPPVIVTMETID
jgi:hypothetical protein